MTLFIILLTISSIVFLINIIFLFLFPKFTQRPAKINNDLNLSVIVAFKNEEKNLESLFSSLEMLDFPKDKFEVILVDDGSTDNSFSKAIKLSNEKKYYRVLQVYNKKLSGKKGALNIGVNAAKYPYILITDADCMPAKNWLLGYSGKFKENYDLLFGLAPFVQIQGIINKISCFENLRSSMLTFTFAKLKLPYSAAARNMGFKKSSFERLGGFGNTMDTISGDDDLLLREAVKHNMKIGIVNLEESFVLSNSKTAFGEYLNQKARHTKTSHHYLMIHKLLLGFWHLSNILVLFSILLSQLNIVFVLPFFIKILSDFLCVLNSQNKFRYSFTFYEIIFLQIFYELFLIINFFSSFQKTIPWKN